MSITLFHAPYSRSIRVRWLLEEMGLAYELERMTLDHASGESGGEAYAAINPLHKVPALKDGDQVVLESGAILQYLLGKYGPSGLEVRPDEPGYGDYLQFLHFGESGLNLGFSLMLAHSLLLPEDKRNPALFRWGEKELKKAFGLIETQLKDHDYLAADRFTAADIMPAYILLLMKLMKRFDAVTEENTRAWWTRLTARDAWKTAMAD